MGWKQSISGRVRKFGVTGFAIEYKSRTSEIDVFISSVLRGILSGGGRILSDGCWKCSDAEAPGGRPQRFAVVNNLCSSSMVDLVPAELKMS